MKLFKAIETRRSIRKYKSKEVSKDDIKTILKAALDAPSWKNSETPRYYVISNSEMLDSLRENCLPPFNARNCENAPVIIVLTFVRGKSGTNADGTWANECEEGWGYFDLGLAAENLCLAARGLGLGTLIMGIRNAAGLRELLQVPEEEQIVAVISLGYPDIDPKRPERRKLKETVHYFD